VDYSVDLWAVGIMMLELMCQECPYSELRALNRERPKLELVIKLFGMQDLQKYDQKWGI
jgi:hypothetical protein